MPVSPNIARMLDLIVCPACHAPLALAEQDASLVCKACARRYNIQEGIPVLIPERSHS